MVSEDKDPSLKAAKYTETGLLLAHDIVASATAWDRNAVITREEGLLTWAQEEWGG